MEINNFVKTIMKEDLENKVCTEIITRFPPEPNFYLHIGHARAIVTNFELAKCFNGKTNLRFDDTNPKKEDSLYVDAILEDLKWLGYTPSKVLYGSDYFEKTFLCAVDLIKKGLAFVCDLSQEEISKTRGDLTTAGIASPYRNRSVEENLKLFYEMKDGKYKEGEKTLRAKIDMAHPNLNMRDPVMYRILSCNHHRLKDEWHIYPMYDFAHPLQDAFEHITHSLCSLEYDNHRILYDWFRDNCNLESKPHQYEFGRLNIENTVLSKRFLKEIVESGFISSFDDPRMPTLVGFKRRGFTPNSIKDFILSTGLSRINSVVPYSLLEEHLRQDLKDKAIRISGILNPLRVTITNYDDGKIEYLDVLNNSDNPQLGSRKIAFSKHLFIDSDDFLLEKPNKHWKRLSKGLEVRLMHAYFIKCNDVLFDEDGNIVELLCTYDINTKSGSSFNERKPNGTINFLEATTSRLVEYRLFDSLLKPDSNINDGVLNCLNPNSLTVIKGYLEPVDLSLNTHLQLVRNGYYIVDRDSTEDCLVLNRTCSLKSSFKI